MNTNAKILDSSVDRDEVFSLNPAVIKRYLPENHHAAFEKDFSSLSDWCRIAKEECVADFKRNFFSA